MGVGKYGYMTPNPVLGRSLSIAALAALALVATSACSSSTTTPSASPTVSSSSTSPSTSSSTTKSPTASPTPTSTVSPVGTPTFIKKGGNKSVPLGTALVINTELVTKVSSSNTAVLKVSQPSKEGADPELNAGALAVSRGTAVLNVYGTLAGGSPNALLYTVNITVT